MEEEMRNAQKKRNGNRTPRGCTDANNYPFSRSNSMRKWGDVWKSYDNAPTKRSEDIQSTRYS